MPYLECGEQHAVLAVLQVSSHQILHKVHLCAQVLYTGAYDDVLEDWEEFIDAPRVVGTQSIFNHLSHPREEYENFPTLALFTNCLLNFALALTRFILSYVFLMIISFSVGLNDVL